MLTICFFRAGVIWRLYWSFMCWTIAWRCFYRAQVDLKEDGHKHQLLICWDKSSAVDVWTLGISVLTYNQWLWMFIIQKRFLPIAYKVHCQKSYFDPWTFFFFRQKTWSWISSICQIVYTRWGKPSEMLSVKGAEDSNCDHIGHLRVYTV